MRSALPDVALIVVAALFAAAGVRRLQAEPDGALVPTPVVAPLRHHLPEFQTGLDGARDDAIAFDPFRLAGAPASVRFDATFGRGRAGVGPEPSSAPNRYRPGVSVKAIGGPPWQAILEGIPGVPGLKLVRPGETHDRIVVRLIKRDTVVLEGPDTTWKLTVRRGR